MADTAAGTRYLAHQDFSHDRAQRIGVLLANLGTPQAPTTPALRVYLREFLSDPRVVELPRWQWLPILHGIILRVRPRRSARAYARVWSDAGSPLMANSLAQLRAVQAAGDLADDTPVNIALGMNYGSPSIAGALDELRLAGVTRLLVLPLFPQYAGSTTGSTFDALGRALSRWRWVPELRFVNGYHDHPAYVEAVARSIEHHRARHGSGEILLLSFHGLPKRYLLSGDPYFCQCQATARLIAERLRLGKDDWRIVFQSRFGREEWLQPYTDETLKQLAADGVRRVDIVCPGFSADCVETLEEIAIEAAATFKEAGGESLSYVPALNADPDHINLVTSLIRDQIDDWRQSARADRAELERRQQRAMALGASR